MKRNFEVDKIFLLIVVLRIQICVDPYHLDSVEDPDPGWNRIRIGSGCSLLRAEGFSCRLDVLLGGLF
jgi:hypothetical protein